MSLVCPVPPNKCQNIKIRSRPLLPIPYSSLGTIFSIHPYIIRRTGSFVMMWWNKSVEIWPSSAYTNNCVWIEDICSSRRKLISCQLMPFCLPSIELHICIIGFPFHILKQFQLQYAQRLLAHGNRCDRECIADDRMQFRSTFAILFCACACLPARLHCKYEDVVCMMCDFSHRTELKVLQIQAQNTQVDIA